VTDEIEVINPKIKAVLRRFLELRDAKDEADAAAKEAKKEHDEAEQELHSLLQEGVEGTLKIPLGEPYGTVSFLPQETIYSNVINERKLTMYLEERQMTDEYSKPALAKGRLNELAREIEEGTHEPVPGLEHYKKRFVRVTRPKNKKKKA
jgi:hypothetical protein